MLMHLQASLASISIHISGFESPGYISYLRDSHMCSAHCADMETYIHSGFTYMVAPIEIIPDFVTRPTRL